MVGLVVYKYVTDHCGILNHLLPGDIVLVDRGSIFLSQLG